MVRRKNEKTICIILKLMIRIREDVYVQINIEIVDPFHESGEPEKGL